MRWRLEKVLGYNRTLPLKMARPDGQGLYTMIFAANHDVGEQIMQSVLAGAEVEQQQLIRATKTRRALVRADRKTASEAFPGFDELLVSGNSANDGAAQLLRLDHPVPPWRFPRRGYLTTRSLLSPASRSRVVHRGPARVPWGCGRPTA